jgi:quercetin dioxygenase-like cupin family protein
MSQNTAISPEIGTKLLFENDCVRVWDLRLEPGQSTGLHRHTCDYLYVVIGDGRLRARDADGKARPAMEMKDGEVRFREIQGEDVHEAVNVGDGPWRNIIVELKK